MRSVKSCGRASVACVACLCGFASFGHAQAPYIDPASDHEHFGSPANLLSWTPEQQVAGYRNSDKIFLTRTIKAGTSARPLPYKLADLDDA